MKLKLIERLFWFIAIPMKRQIHNQEIELKRLKDQILLGNQHNVAFRVREAGYKNDLAFLNQKVMIQEKFISRFVEKNPKMAKMINKELEKSGS